jgi:hypothetical protein
MVGSGSAQAKPFDQRFTATYGTAAPRRERRPAQPVMATGPSQASRSTVIVEPFRVSLLSTMY